MVNTLHHLGIKTLSHQLTSIAMAEDGLIEAAYMPEKRFILAMQWHPEYSYKSDGYSRWLFQAFAEASMDKKVSFHPSEKIAH